MYEIRKEEINNSGAEPWNNEKRRQRVVELESMIVQLIYEDTDSDINQKEAENVRIGATLRPRWFVGFFGKINILKRVLQELANLQMISGPKYVELDKKLVELTEG